MIVVKESTLKVPRYVLYVMHYVVNKGIVFVWGQIISNDIAHQLSIFEKTQILFDGLVFGVCNPLF
jgi:hypothetical protein